MTRVGGVFQFPVSVPYYRHGVRSDFFFHRLDETTVAVIDLNLGNMSVTNDAENVVRWLMTRGSLANGDRLIYRDSDGLWGQIEFDAQARRVWFVPLRATTIKEALERLQ